MVKKKENTIIVVDDEPDTVATMSLLLEYEGYHPIEAISGHQALELMEKERPQIVLLDIMMAEMSGWEVLDQMRKNQSFKSIPVVLLSASPIPENRKHSPTWQEFLLKPFNLEDLLNVIDRVLKVEKIKRTG